MIQITLISLFFALRDYIFNTVLLDQTYPQVMNDIRTDLGF